MSFWKCGHVVPLPFCSYFICVLDMDCCRSRLLKRLGVIGFMLMLWTVVSCPTSQSALSLWTLFGPSLTYLWMSTWFVPPSPAISFHSNQTDSAAQFRSVISFSEMVRWTTKFWHLYALSVKWGGFCTDAACVLQMIVEPENRVPDFIKAGADIVSVHCENASTIHLHRTINQVCVQELSNLQVVLMFMGMVIGISSFYS